MLKRTTVPDTRIAAPPRRPADRRDPAPPSARDAYDAFLRAGGFSG
jgi:hypothetical protein